MNRLASRIRKLEQKTRCPTPRIHVVLMPRGGSAEAERAKITDFADGDEIIYIRFVAPGDDLTPVD